MINNPTGKRNVPGKIDTTSRVNSGCNVHERKQQHTKSVLRFSYTVILGFIVPVDSVHDLGIDLRRKGESDALYNESLTQRETARIIYEPMQYSATRRFQ